MIHVKKLRGKLVPRSTSAPRGRYTRAYHTPAGMRRSAHAHARISAGVLMRTHRPVCSCAHISRCTHAHTPAGVLMRAYRPVCACIPADAPMARMPTDYSYPTINTLVSSREYTQIRDTAHTLEVQGETSLLLEPDQHRSSRPWSRKRRFQSTHLF